MSLILRVGPELEPWFAEVVGGPPRHDVISAYLVQNIGGRGDIETSLERLEGVRALVISGLNDPAFESDAAGNSCTLTVSGAQVGFVNEFDETSWTQLKGDEMLVVLDAWKRFLQTGGAREVVTEVA